MIVPIGAWVLRTACAEAAKWPENIKVAVNLSPVQFKRRREIVDTVLYALRDAGLRPERLELEVTESVLIHDNETALSIVEELRAHGVGVSLDDFGTGFSSLAYLNDFPFTKVKIDRRFSESVCHSIRTRSIIKAIAQLTYDLGMELVAEGIESNDQLNCIAELGVGMVQGYIYSRPLSSNRVRDVFGGPLPVSKHQPESSKTEPLPHRTAA